MREADKARVGAQLWPGEVMLADASARSLAAGANQSALALRLVLTNERVFALEQNIWTGRVTGTVALGPIPLDEVAALETATEHPASTLGIPMFVVRLAVHREASVTLGASGFGIRRLRQLTERLVQIRPGLPSVATLLATT